MALLIAVLGAGAASDASARHGPSQAVNDAGAGWPIDQFTLTDQDGKPFTEQRLEGRWTFVLLGDTRCGEPCAAALAALHGMCQRIARTEAVKTTQVLFVSLDPDRDVPQRLREYMTPYDEHFVAASAPMKTLESFVDELGAADSLAAARGSQPETRRYPGSLFLLGPDGVVRGEFLPPFDVKLLTARYLKTRARR
jgi:protein SCO1/2